MVVATTVFIGCSASKKSIESVLAQRAAAYTNCLVQISGKAAMIQAMDSPLGKQALANGHSTFLDEREFAAEITTIDVSKCPKDFQIAWSNDVAAWKRFSDSRGSKLFALGQSVMEKNLFPLIFAVQKTGFSQLDAAEVALYSSIASATR